MKALRLFLTALIAWQRAGILRDLPSSGSHPPYLSRHRTTAIASRVRLVAAGFAIPTVLWIFLDGFAGGDPGLPVAALCGGRGRDRPRRAGQFRRFRSQPLSLIADGGAGWIDGVSAGADGKPGSGFAHPGRWRICPQPAGASVIGRRWWSGPTSACIAPKRKEKPGASSATRWCWCPRYKEPEKKPAGPTAKGRSGRDAGAYLAASSPKAFSMMSRPSFRTASEMVSGGRKRMTLP